jgi:3' exoribonuclease, RNase T-like
MTITCHIIIDLEALGPRPKALIADIGAWIFHVDNGEKKVEVSFPRGFCCPWIDPQTDWQFDASVWDEEGEDIAPDPEKYPKPVQGLSLRILSDWIAGFESVVLYGNGAAFENMILRNAYMQYGIECPSPPAREACFRTLMIDPPCKLSKEKVAELRDGINKHLTLDRAVFKGKLLSAAYSPEYFIGISNALLNREQKKT